MKYREHAGVLAFKEEFISFKSEGQKVVGTFYLPDTSKEKCPAVLLAHGFTGSRNADARLFVWAGRALAHNGIAALAIDFRGSGESECDFSEMTIDAEVADAKAAIEYLCARDEIDPGRIGMAGHSMGGFVTICTASEEDRIKSVALWAGLSDNVLLENKLHDLEDGGRCEGDLCDVGGLLVSKELYRSSRRRDIAESLKKSRSSVLVIHGTDDETVPLSNGEDSYKWSVAAGKKAEFHSLEGVGHVFRGIECREELIEKTVMWFKQEL